MIIMFPSILSVNSLTRFNPLVIHVYWLRQKLYSGLKVLQNSALDSGRTGRILALFHFHFTTFLMVTK